MSNLRIFFWASFGIALVVLVSMNIYVNSHSNGFDLMKLQFASSREGTEILRQWYHTDVDGHSQLHFVKLNTIIDFLFIIGYAGVLCMISYTLMQRESRVWVNELLRWCFPLALLTGLLDVIENSLILSSLYHYRAGDAFHATQWVSYPKWTLVVIILMIWIIGLIAKMIRQPGVRVQGA